MINKLLILIMLISYACPVNGEDGVSIDRLILQELVNPSNFDGFSSNAKKYINNCKGLLNDESYAVENSDYTLPALAQMVDKFKSAYADHEAVLHDEEALAEEKRDAKKWLVFIGNAGTDLAEILLKARLHVAEKTINKQKTKFWNDATPYPDKEPRYLRNSEIKETESMLTELKGAFDNKDYDKIYEKFMYVKVEEGNLRDQNIQIIKKFEPLMTAALTEIFNYKDAERRENLLWLHKEGGVVTIQKLASEKGAWTIITLIKDEASSFKIFNILKEKTDTKL